MLAEKGSATCRWANAASPAYGALSDHQFMRRHAGEKRQEKARAAWGNSLSSPADIAAVFVKYASGKTFGSLRSTSA